MKESSILIYTQDVFPQEKEQDMEKKIREKEVTNMDHLGYSLHFSEGESALAALYLEYSPGHPKAADPIGAPAMEQTYQSCLLIRFRKILYQLGSISISSLLSDDVLLKFTGQSPFNPAMRFLEEGLWKHEQYCPK